MNDIRDWAVIKNLWWHSWVSLLGIIWVKRASIVGGNGKWTIKVQGTTNSNLEFVEFAGNNKDLAWANTVGMETEAPSENGCR